MLPKGSAYAIGLARLIMLSTHVNSVMFTSSFTEAAAMMDAVSAYHLLRGATLEKIVKTPTKTTDDESKVEVDGDKTTTKSTKSTKTSAAEATALPDYIKYIAALDTKEYHACYSKLVDLSNAYVRASLVMTKNAKRLTDPRGDNEGQSANYSSMY